MIIELIALYTATAERTDDTLFVQAKIVFSGGVVRVVSCDHHRRSEGSLSPTMIDLGDSALPKPCSSPVRERAYVQEKIRKIIFPSHTYICNAIRVTHNQLPRPTKRRGLVKFARSIFCDEGFRDKEGSWSA